MTMPSSQAIRRQTQKKGAIIGCARGNVRVLRPAGEDQYVVEAERVYEEALALAQQIQNKDIPEGGAKALLLLAPGQAVERSVRAFLEALLDLSIEGVAGMAEGGPAVDAPLYLGPDENISPELIEWAAARAKERGHPHPGTFMSFAAAAGIAPRSTGW